MIRETLLAELTFESDSTKKVFEAITNDVLDYKPNPFNWSIAELASHTSEIYNWWDVTLNQDRFDLANYKYDKGDISNIDNIKAKLDENIAQAIKCLEFYNEEKFYEPWSMWNGEVNVMPEMPRIQVIRSVLMNHLYHHRGVLIGYLRANNKPVPGIYGPSYEEQQMAVSDN